EFNTGRNNNKAFELFINASKKSHILAQYFVRLCYEFGNETAKNEKLAFEYYEKVANEDCAAGVVNLSYFYYNSIGVKKDLIVAVYWYKKAASLGNNMAQCNLALMYKSGEGINKDYDKAFELFKQSAEGDYSEGILQLAYCY